MNITLQKAWRAEQIATSEIAKFDKGAQIDEGKKDFGYDYLVTSSRIGLQYGVEIKRSEFARTKEYVDYFEKLQRFQANINVPILLVCINESSEEVRIGIVFSWFHRRPSVTRDIVLWRSTQENWDKVLNLFSISVHMDGPIEFLPLDNLYVRKTINLSVDIPDGRRYIAELVYMRKLLPDYKINPIKRDTLQDEMRFYLNGYETKEYPSDSLDEAIYSAIQKKFNNAFIKNELMVMNTELRDLQIYREYNRGQVLVQIAPRLDDANDAVMRLISGFSEFHIKVELYAHSVEDKDYFNNMAFIYREAVDGWERKLIEYKKCFVGYKKLSDIIG